MAKTITKRILPIMFVVLILFSAMPITALAAGPEISTEPTSEITGGAPSDSSTPNSGAPDISTGPNDESNLPSSSQPPDSSTPPESLPESQPDSSVPEPPAESEDSSVPSESVSAEGEAENEVEDAAGGMIDGATVQFVYGKNRARSIGPQAPGALSIPRIQDYKWD